VELFYQKIVGFIPDGIIGIFLLT